MLKLTDAKCPSCGAKLEVNDKLEKTICQYCGSTVFIEEAIQKIKLELSGKVEVDGIKGRSAKIKQALKHKKIKEYDKAYELLKEVIKDDEFDIEALCELIKLDIDVLRTNNFNERSSEPYDPEGWQAVKEIVATYKRIEEVDDNKESVSMLEDCKDKIEHYIEVADKLEKENSEFDQYVNKIIQHYDELNGVGKEYLDEWYGMFVDKMGYESSEKMYGPHYLSSLKKITRDGVLVAGSTEVFPETRYNAALLKKNLDEFLVDSKQYIKSKKSEKNSSIDKTNKKIDRKNSVINAKIKFRYFKIALYSLIIIAFVGFTIAVYFDSGWLDTILTIIFFDSWGIYFPAMGISDNIFEIKFQKKVVEENQKGKAKHV